MDLSIREVLKTGENKSDNKKFVFKPTEEECNNGLLHVCYSSAKDRYCRVTCDNKKTDSWLDWSYSSINIFRKYEYDWGMTYLARDEVYSPWGGEISWKFDTSGTDKRMDRLEFRAPTALYEDGCIIWTICTDKQNFVQTSESLQDFVTFELQGATSLSITAFLTGGRGCCRYQHAQLFRQSSHEDYYPFQVKIYLQTEATEPVTYDVEDEVTRVKSCNETKTGYLFSPNEMECMDEAMRITYDASKDVYRRRTCDWSDSYPSWMDFTYSSTNIQRTEDKNMFLSLTDGSEFGKVSWKFDVKDSGLKLKQLRMMAPSRIKDSKSVVWLVCSGKQCYMETGHELDKYMTFELEGSTELSITAFLIGGRAGKSARLFENNFEIELDMEKNSDCVKKSVKLAEEVAIAQDMPGVGNSFVFKPTAEEVGNKIMHVCYSCTNDTYLRKSSHDEILYSWQNYVNSFTNLFRKENMYKWVTYIVREDSDLSAAVSWKFDVEETDMKLKKVEIRGSSAVFESGSVHWIISTEKDVQSSDSLQEASTFHLSDASTLTVTAILAGGEGSNAWEHSQLFPQPSDDVGSFPFEIKVCFDWPGAIIAAGGNIDASTWRQPRGEFGLPAEICTRVDKGFVFKPNDKEIARKKIHVSYCAARDSYSRKLSPSDADHSWLDYTFSSTNMYRKEEYDHDMVYLARIEGTQYAEVTWKFDVTGTGLKMRELEMKAHTALYKDASVLWTVCAGDRKYIKTASYFGRSDYSETFDMDGATTMTITAFLTGGKSLVAWQHSQLFRQGIFEKDSFPFDVQLVLERSSQPEIGERFHEGTFAVPAESSSQFEREFVFKPTENEISEKLIHVGFSTLHEHYVRLSNFEEKEGPWQDCTYSYTNLVNSLDYDNRTAYLVRNEGSQFAEVTWKFDVTDVDLCMDVLGMKAMSRRYEDGCIVWTIQADEKKFIQTGDSLEDMLLFDLSGSKTISITAFLAGGKGSDAWKHSQLFPHRMDDNETEFPFEVKLFLKEGNSF